MSIEQLDFFLSVNEKILPYLNDAILIVQKDGKIINGNKLAYSMLKIDEGKSFLHSYIDFDLLEYNQQRSYITNLKEEKAKQIDLRIINISDTLHYVLMKQLSVTAENYQVNELLSKNSSEGVMIFENNMLVDIDSALATMLGYSREELKNKSISNLFQKEETSLFLLPEVNVYRGLKKNGSSIFVELVERPYYDGNNEIRIAVVRDLTDQVQQDKIIKQLVYFDKLTGLPNLKFFTHALREAIQSNNITEDKAIAVYFIDLNYFKEINETLGYEFGDKLLTSCVIRIRTLLDSHSFLSRIRGDEFLIFKQNIYDFEQAEDLANKLIDIFKKPVNIDGYDIYISICVGISVYPEHGEKPMDLIKHADSAMYDVKRKYQNCYNFYNSAITQKFQQTLERESELRHALKNNEFELFYQPQNNVLTEKVVGFEALLRWKHPKKGYILPGEFIPLAEKTGLIIEMGDWVLREACRQCKTWQDEGYEPTNVSVNMSAKQIHQPGLVDKVKNTLEETGLAPHYLELEITESMAMTYERLILRTMQELRELGVYVSIDDFGTGYSSFKYLSVFPISKLKIDRMFLNDQQKHNQAIVKSIIHMSHSLNLRVIAEGVETENQLEFLRNEKCDEVQGYYFSKPLPAAELSPFLRKTAQRL
ncbi:EAL domain-containing protein [Virgibacillus sp. MSJ-26]|uniref:EAL domain-containing protein n=1 Tax=Virgibacillus sp. MSJ-26 TaxID=2841522 RepID=UPI001C0FAF2F|nr:EAL domain-containing protein [Virgibacillus sp. MSJ-26]MBU5468399.1 EAL domain-containing protein [Virgibacillus sp. MSJ-26]